MPAAQWSQWAASYAKDTLGGSTLGLLVKFSGVLHRQSVCTSGPLLLADPCLQRLKHVTGMNSEHQFSCELLWSSHTQLVHGFTCSMAGACQIACCVNPEAACTACWASSLVSNVMCACMLIQIKDKEGAVSGELEDRRSQHWLFVRGPLPDKLPVRELDLPWQLFSLQ